MKSFELFRIHLYNMGLLQMDSSWKATILAISRNCIIYTFSIVQLIITSWFFLFKAETMDESIDSFISVSISFLLFAWFSVCIWYKQNHVMLFDECDAIINESEWNLTKKKIFNEKCLFQMKLTIINHNFNISSLDNGHFSPKFVSKRPSVHVWIFSNK